MYFAYLDQTCILDASREILLENPTLELADNTAGSFIFTIYKNNPGFKHLNMLASVVTVLWEEEVLFKGRIIEMSRNFDKSLSVTCEENWLILQTAFKDRPNTMTSLFGITLQHLFRFITARLKLKSNSSLEP